MTPSSISSIRWTLFLSSALAFLPLAASSSPPTVPETVVVPDTSGPPPFTPLRTLHVSPTGPVEGDGLSPETAFRTISAAAAAVRPGDLVLVSGGTYHEHVHLTEPGTEEHPIVFRAAPGETALVIAADFPEKWQKAGDGEKTYTTPLSYIPNQVMDNRHLVRYSEVHDLNTLDEMPGTYLYDEENQTLFVHPLRGLTPEEVEVFTISYARPAGAGAPPGERGYAFDKGFWTRAPHNRVEGFHIAYQPFGIQLRSDHTEAWNNTVYGCAITGIQAFSGEGGVLGGNRAYLNDGSGVHVAGAPKTRVVGNLSWGNTQRGPGLQTTSGGHPQNLALYGRVPDPTVEGNLVLARIDPAERGTRLVRYKSAMGEVVSRRNAFIGGTAHVSWGDRSEVFHNTVVGGDFRVRGGDRPVITPETAGERGSTAGGNLYLDANKMEEAGFADPARWDFRLRADSPHLGEGAWPEPAPVRYVSPEGDDDADGKTPGTAWKTLGHAAGSMTPGQTLYVLPGTYRGNFELTVEGTEEKPVHWLTYGRGRVVIEPADPTKPALTLNGVRHFTMDGFIFQAGEAKGALVEIHDGSDLKLVDNVFDGGAPAVRVENGRNLVFANNTFVDCHDGVVIENGRDLLVLRNTLWVRSEGSLANWSESPDARLISERNAFAGPDAATQLEEWKKGISEAHPSLVAGIDVEGPDYQLPTLSRYSFGGLGRRPLGARGEIPDDSPVEIAEFRIPHNSPERAVAEWITPTDTVSARLTWTDPDGNRERVTLRQDGAGVTARQIRLQQVMDGLQPDTSYNVALEVWTPDGRRGTAELSFQTPEGLRDPTTLYVSAETGDDANKGRSEEEAFRTISAAVYAANPGDTILVNPGIYRETIRLMGGGIDEDQHLILRSVQPGEAIIDQGGIRPGAIVVEDVEHVTIDGFRFRGMTYGSLNAVVSVQDAADVRIVNCFFERGLGRGVSSQLVSLNRVDKVLIENNLFQRGFNNIQATHVNHLTVNRNTFYKAGVTGVQVHGVDDPHFTFTNNIFYDVSDRGHGAIRINRPTENLVLDNNLYYRNEDSLMGLISFRQSPDGEHLPATENPKTVEELKEQFGLGDNERIGDPLFLDPDNGDFRVAGESPAVQMAGEGGQVGASLP